jgi:amino acid transporter
VSITILVSIIVFVLLCTLFFALWDRTKDRRNENINVHFYKRLGCSLLVLIVFGLVVSYLVGLIVTGILSP